MGLKFRYLTAGEVECRVGMAKENGVTLLLYKDARCDMNILDETVGAERWQREHYEVKGNMFCRVGIKFGDEWVWKADCGTESNTEKEKGESSDSFKRSCFCWGLGRELYTSPFVWIPAESVKIVPKGQNAWQTFDRFRVDHMEVVDGKITELHIYNETQHKTVFVWPKETKKQQAEREAKATENVVLCKKCNAMILPEKDKKGEILAPKQVAEKLGGLCKKCYREERDGK